MGSSGQAALILLMTSAEGMTSSMRQPLVEPTSMYSMKRMMWPAEPADPGYRGEVADRWRYTDGGGEFGVISSVTRPFCRDCTRARLSADGKLYTCLFAVAGRDVRAVLRDGSTDEELRAFLADAWLVRDDRYSELRAQSTSDLPRIEMFAMGG